MLLVPGVFPHFCFIGMGKYLSAQGILAPSVCIALVANVLHGGLNWLLIYRRMAALTARRWPPRSRAGRSCSCCSSTCGAPASGTPRPSRVGGTRRVLGSPREPAASCGSAGRWAPHTRATTSLPFLRALLTFFAVLQGALMMGLEAWSFETTTLLAGLLGTVPLAAHMVLLNTIGFTFLSFPFALGG